MGTRPLRRWHRNGKGQPTLRISSIWHIYTGLAIPNPAVRIQIERFAASATELFEMMLEGGSGSAEGQRKFRDRVEWARSVVFGDERSVVRFFSYIGQVHSGTVGRYPFERDGAWQKGHYHYHQMDAPPLDCIVLLRNTRSNPHLSLLVMVDC